jgi:hypothetical protein
MEREGAGLAGRHGYLLGEEIFDRRTLQNGAARHVGLTMGQQSHDAESQSSRNANPYFHLPSRAKAHR